MSATVLDSAWDLSPADRLVVEAKRWGSRLRFAVMLLFYRARGRFPRDAAEVDKEAVADLAHRLGMPAPGSRAALLPASDDRTLKRQRAETGRQPSNGRCRRKRDRSRDTGRAADPPPQRPRPGQRRQPA